LSRSAERPSSANGRFSMQDVTREPTPEPAPIRRRAS
jgi:hypothetical protein